MDIEAVFNPPDVGLNRITKVVLLSGAIVDEGCSWTLN